MLVTHGEGLRTFCETWYTGDSFERSTVNHQAIVVKFSLVHLMFYVVQNMQRAQALLGFSPFSIIDERWIRYHSTHVYT